MAEHRLKTWPQYFEAVKSGEKNFEVRRDDRGFQKGDTLILQHWRPDATDKIQGGHYVYKSRNELDEVRRIITWILTGAQFGIEAGYVVMGLQEPKI